VIDFINKEVGFCEIVGKHKGGVHRKRTEVVGRET
jgi:hypothetical protein